MKLFRVRAVFAILGFLSFGLSHSWADQVAPTDPCEPTIVGHAIPTTLPKKTRVSLLVEGSGDVVSKYYITALIAEIKAYGGTHDVDVTFSDYSNEAPNSDKEAKRLRIKAQIEAAGFTYLNKFVKADNDRYLAARPNAVVIATGGKQHPKLLAYWRSFAESERPKIFIEKPFGDSATMAEQMLATLPAFAEDVQGIDHYLPKVYRGKAKEEEDLAFLGGRIKDMDFIFTEDGSGADPAIKDHPNAKRDGAIEIVERGDVLAPGVGPDMLSHVFGLVNKHGRVSTARPLEVRVGRYLGRDGDPNKPTEISRETFYAANFVFEDFSDDPVKHLINGHVVIGKGVRTKKYGKKYEHEAKLVIVTGINGKKIVSDLRSKGDGASVATYQDADGRDVKAEALESMPYASLFRYIFDGATYNNTYTLSIEAAVAVQHRNAAFTQNIDVIRPIPTYPGGMGGEHFRESPYAEDLEATLPLSSGPGAKSLREDRPNVPADRKFGIIGGTGVMGRGYSFRVATVAGAKLTIRDLNPEALQIIAAMGEGLEQKPDIILAKDLPEFVASLERPRKIMFLVTNAKVFDIVYQELKRLLDPGDIIIDGGNSEWTKTESYQRDAAKYGIEMLGMGVSGGERGAKNGSAMMVGGNLTTWEKVRGIFEAIAGRVPPIAGEPESPSVALMGPGGSGHYIKMVHNGIEYVEMQLIAEAYDMLKNTCGLTIPQIQEIFAKWASDDNASFLIQITAKVLARIDPKTGNHLVEMVKAVARQKGTGRWATEASLQLGAYTPAMAEAVYARNATALEDQRAGFNHDLAGPHDYDLHATVGEVVDALTSALYAARVLNFAGGFDLIKLGSKEHFNNAIDLAEVTKIWRIGSILQGSLLDRLHVLFKDKPGLRSIFEDASIQSDLSTKINALRRVNIYGVTSGIPVPAFSSLLNYYDTIRRVGGPANLIAALRDYFGGHLFERIDDPVVPGQDPPLHHDQWVNDDLVPPELKDLVNPAQPDGAAPEAPPPTKTP